MSQGINSNFYNRSSAAIIFTLSGHVYIYTYNCVCVCERVRACVCVAFSNLNPPLKNVILPDFPQTCRVTYQPTNHGSHIKETHFLNTLSSYRPSVQNLVFLVARKHQKAAP